MGNRRPDPAGSPGNRYMPTLVAAVIAGGLSLLGAKAASADPIMSIDQDRTVADYDLGHLGDEARFEYLVTNTTPGTDSGDEMISFKLPGGSDQGVFYATAPTDWSFTINLQDTMFASEGANILPNGGQGLFELYSTDLNIHQDDATAMSRINGAFNPVSVDVPSVPEPTTLALLGLGLAGLVGVSKYRKRKLQV